jgi:mevalonate kinase
VSDARDAAPCWEAPVRVCLAGENLDWIGKRSTCVAVALPTRVRGAATAPACGPEPLQNLTWDHISSSINETQRPPPAVSIEQSAPPAGGLATSSALTMCLLQAQRELVGAEPLPRGDIIQLAYELERRVTNGGGMDQLCIGRGGALLLDGRNHGLPKVIDRACWPEDWCFVVVDSGIPKHSPTRIADVRRRLAVGDPALLRYIELADRSAASIWRAIGDRRLDQISELLDDTHGTMRDHQRSSTRHLERLRSVLLDSGCTGVKLTGAGGGGALFTISTKEAAPGLARDLRTALQAEDLPSRVLVAPVDYEGLRPSGSIKSAGSSWKAAAAPRRPYPSA